MTSTHSSAAGTIQLRQNRASPKVKLVIHNQFPGIELVSPVYAGRFVACHLSPDQRVVIGSTTQVGFNTSFSWGDPIGILIYELKRKNTKNFNRNIISSEDEATYFQLFVKWGFNSSKEFRVNLRVIEHDKSHIWDRDKLMELAKLHQLYDIQHGPVEYACLMCDNTVLRARMNATREEECYKLEITIYEGSVDEDTQRIQYLDMDSFAFKPTMKVNIRNQCSNFKLINRKYFENNMNWNKYPDEAIDAGSMTSADLTSNWATFEGVIMYQLQRKWTKHDGQPRSTVTLLFIAWKSDGYKGLCVRVHLIGYDKQIKWNRIKLKEYYQRYANQLSTYNGPIRDTWLMPNITVLMTELKLDLTQRDSVLNIAISEGTSDDYIREPERINPKIFDKEALNITIRNPYSDLELTSPVYYSNGTTCYVSPRQQACIGITLASFEIDSQQKDVRGALLYKLQRKHTTKADNWPNSNTESIENTAINTYLLVVWEIGDYYHTFPVCLIECNNDLTWDEDKLWVLHHQYINHLYNDYNYSTCTWLTNDNILIRTRSNITFGSDYKVDIIISEVTGAYDLFKPMKIDPESLDIQPSVKLNIHNRCLNVDLISPTYVTSDGLECHRPPAYRVCVGDTMRSGFLIKPNDESHGVLIYKIQRRQPHKSTKISEDTSSAAQLLVIWRVFESNKSNVVVLVVEHDKRLDGNKDGLVYFHNKSFGRFRRTPGSTTVLWTLDDNTALMITPEIMNEDRILDITISEVERDNGIWTLAYINLKSFELQLPAYITIHNQCSNIKLTSPVYFSNDALCPKLSGQQIYISAKMRANIEIYVTQNDFEGVLLFKLQGHSNWSNMDASTTETNRNEATHAHMLVIWEVKNAKPFAYVALIKHAKEFTWTRDELEKLYNKNRDWLKKYDGTTSCIWFMGNNIALKTSFRARALESNPELSIFISEEKRNNCAMRPFYIDLKSLALQLSVSLNIHNWCQDINLISPVYFIHGGKWNAEPDQEVDASTVVQNNLEFDAGQNILEGALIYRVQGKYVESDQDESKRTWLLVAWRGEHTKGLDVCALLVEYNKQLDEDRLRRLYQKRWPSLKARANATRSNWTLDNTTTLETTIKVMNGGYRWDLFISERT